MRLSRVFASFPLIVIAACTPPKSVQYFKDHAREREALIDNCGGKADQECRNARQAGFDVRHIAAEDGSALLN